MAPVSGAYNPEFLDDFLPLYYGKLFPINAFYKWITYSDKSRGGNREISFTLRDDVYIRFQSFSNEQDFQRALKDKRPHKIDIGAVYNYSMILASSTFCGSTRDVVVYIAGCVMQEQEDFEQEPGQPLPVISAS
ncbi:hypothetical protein HPB51_024944 [Rhipicephalus microplus]|uniref:Uncharacterized protein n=1 Tax=Rhipicephalus microplus TaxID=6941 RepID=A0A9J6DDR7_RHIMP|nr:hypothetical protein HPB51_024944 [Rhipicephalus microplus]